MQLFVLALIPTVFGALAVQRRSEPAPLHLPRDADGLIPDQYIVKYYDVSASSAIEAGMKKLSTKPKHVYEGTFRGFAAKLDQKTLELLRNDPSVEYVEHDAKVWLNSYVSQEGAPWGLARISSRKLGNMEYTYEESAGVGTCSYVLDSGVQVDHPEFGGRVSQIYGESNSNNHGTHVAGIIGSDTYGVAKRTTLLSVQVIDQYGSAEISDVVAAMDFIMRDAASRVCPNGVFVNVSLGSSNSPALNAAVRNLVEADIFVAVAAGNRNYDAIDYSPANEPLACTVGATNQTDGRAAGTNFGSVVDVFAPGQGILSTGLNNSTYSASGTSTATPHVVGLAAYLSGLKGYQGARATCARIAELATKDVLSDLPSGTANRLAYNGGSPRP